ncbi:bifunctional diaminohydroxyphosphoribosylaminopyrimidine deaminase/5-amino-6-(5-phosphoribosylamino)uracil reductase RibD [Xenophilus arseniciresistens]|uniref:Riboflavin biosynthesis protein RibD n=1 Tax=Xenophilus arseniciresistens TaxID=1283306 RepID=A0AAE3SYW0_9BURK|nr:bifunctional diaminohydroxyphosphoribosylaminopyrimidine deaminase/5-amino-6-(5-phosphoribosylamino)uracil reductase RibD [Xenophilus arseniciresistens]MDA7415206.1 bifunctional diaminohydroxyphosphoribosylaminopyrimidine deaminase/5-amino-6-(5-phosphoribosylamino)uracil reductase RibD [Xenophilus arseniciresistens]
MSSLPAFMARALAQAQKALVISSPNPRVGCVLTDAQGRVLGEGHTQRAGGPHAEVMALRDARSRGAPVSGATAWVTLEPCSHQGRTGPCCDALVAAGIGRVVASLSDPNPRVGGQGFARLRAAGVQVDVGPGAAESRELNLGFLSRMVRGQPWVRVKAAASLDGFTALPNGASQWITGAQARADGHAWRARASALLTGVGTVLADDPRMDVRDTPLLAQLPRQPALAVVDSALRTPPTARLFEAERPIWIYTASTDTARADALRGRGAEVIYLPDGQGRVALPALMAELAQREVNELHVEGGQQLNGALMRAGLVDEWLLYLAPKLMGAGAGLSTEPFAGGPLTSLAMAPALEFHSTQMLGPDLRIVARMAGRDTF